MKNLLFVFIAFLVACGGGDKQAQLAKLKKERETLDQQIKELEAQMSDSTGGTANTKTSQVALLDIKKQSFDHYIELQGRIDGEENVGVTSQMLGVVKAVYVKPGDAVRKDQVMAEFDASVLEQNLANLKSSLTFVTDIYNRQKALWDQQIGSEVQYLTAKNNMESLQNQIKALEDQIEMSKIKAPIAGNVEEVGIKLGQAVAPGYFAFRVVNFARIKAAIDVAENYASKVRVGNSVVLSFPDINHEINAKVDFTSKFINPVNRTFLTEVRFVPDGKTDYKANMLVMVRINDYHRTDAIVLPVNLIQTDSKGEFVYVAEKKGDKMQAVKRVVKLGMEYNGLAEITEGLAEGDQVVRAGYQSLEEGEYLSL